MNNPQGILAPIASMCVFVYYLRYTYSARR